MIEVWFAKVPHFDTNGVLLTDDRPLDVIDRPLDVWEMDVPPRQGDIVYFKEHGWSVVEVIWYSPNLAHAMVIALRKDGNDET